VVAVGQPVEQLGRGVAQRNLVGGQVEIHGRRVYGRGPEGPTSRGESRNPQLFT